MAEKHTYGSPIALNESEIALVADGQTISAVKAIRSRTGCTLREAMDCVDPKAARERSVRDAAPDLLDALQDLLTRHIAHHNEPGHVRARAAIAKAEGRAP